MPVIGITGGVATGKSAVTALLRARGAIVFSADEAARAVTVPGSPLLLEIAQVFGQELLESDGTLNRARLGALIFANETARQRLNRLMHPPILRLLHAQIEAARDDFSPQTPVVVEVPLLFETNLSEWFDQIVVVDASQTVQVARLMARNGLDQAEAMQRIAAQWPMETKKARADTIIDNNGTYAQLEAAVLSLWNRSRSGGCRSQDKNSERIK